MYTLTDTIDERTTLSVQYISISVRQYIDPPTCGVPFEQVSATAGHRPA